MMKNLKEKCQLMLEKIKINSKAILDKIKITNKAILNKIKEKSKYFIETFKSKNPIFTKYLFNNKLIGLIAVLLVAANLLSLSIFAIAESSPHKNILLTDNMISSNDLLNSLNNLPASLPTSLPGDTPEKSAVPEKTAVPENKSMLNGRNASTKTSHTSGNQSPTKNQSITKKQPISKNQSTTENSISTANLPASEEVINTPEYVVIRPSELVTFSSDTTARVSILNVKEGSYFKKNDVLLELDCREQEADLRKAKAQQQSMVMADKSAKKLHSYGSISEYELVKAHSEAVMSNAEVAKLTAIVDKCIIIAPFNGAVSNLMVHTYETVKPGDPLLKIVNTENLELDIQVPSAWLQWLHVGTNFDVQVGEINKTISAKITNINPQIDSVSQTVKIIGVITETESRLLPGMSGQAIFPDNPTTEKVESTN